MSDASPLTPALTTPSLDVVPLNGLCRVRDFAPLTPWIDLVAPFGRTTFGPDFPSGVEYRKHWETAQSVRALAINGSLGPDAEILGIGAGNEPTLFVLTNHVRRVFGTDLYLAEGWEESANVEMLREPGITWTSPWNPRRLVTQHMDALDLRYPDDSFDGAFSASSIEHFGTHDNVRRSLEEAFRVLRPGGLYAVSTEFRISGPGPGLPNTLIFDHDELRSIVDDSAPWEIVGPWAVPDHVAEPDPVISFREAADAVTVHSAEHGEIKWDALHWPAYPHVRLHHDDIVWTSVHLALRKPGGQRTE